MRTGVAVIHAAIWVFGGILLVTGFVRSQDEMAWLAALVGQAGSPNPRLLEKLRLVPMLSAVTGAELLLLAVSLKCVRRRKGLSGANAMQGCSPGRGGFSGG